jgi:predicted small metal-binding protein
MSKKLTCVVEGCEFKFEAATEEGLLKKVGEHAAADHGVKEVPPELLVKVKEAIREA